MKMLELDVNQWLIRQKNGKKKGLKLDWDSQRKTNIFESCVLEQSIPHFLNDKNIFLRRIFLLIICYHNCFLTESFLERIGFLLDLTSS